MAVATPTQTPGGSTGAEASGQTERLIRAAHVILDGCGYPMGARKVHRLVRRFQTTVSANGWSLFDFIATAIQLDAEQRRSALLNPDIARTIAYADPTGETAVSHVMREQGQS